MTAQGNVAALGGRDWLAELRGTDDEEVFADLVIAAAAADLKLEAVVCEVAEERFEWGDWARGIFASARRKAAETVPVVVPVKVRRRPLVWAKPVPKSVPEKLVAGLGKSVAPVPAEEEAGAGEAPPPFSAKIQPPAEEEEEAEPEAEAEPEPAEEGRAPRVPFAKDKPVFDEEPAQLSAAAPYDNARAFAGRRCWRAGSLVVYGWRGKFWEWNGRVYQEMAEADVKGSVYEFLDASVKREFDKKNNSVQLVRFRPTPKNVNDLLDGLRSGLGLPTWCEPPMRLDTGERAGEVLMFNNALVEVATGARMEPSPRLWVHNDLGYEWDPGAKCPGWLAFLEGIFPGDQEAKDCVEEFIGLSMTEEVKFHKGLLMVGKPRSGKGTIIHVTGSLVGGMEFASLEFDKWLGPNEFAREALLGKKVLAFPDVRLKPGKYYGQNFDPGGVDHKSVEYLLKICSGDDVTIPRKYNPKPWHGVLFAKVLIASNKVPNFNDKTLPTRFIKLAFDVSYLDREDVTLLGRLQGELPGIAVRCLAAYRRLCARGRFIQPRSGLRLERDIRQTSDPMTQFMEETFVVDPDGSVIIGSAFTAMKSWAARHGNPIDLTGLVKRHFLRAIRAVPDFAEVSNDGLRQHGADRRYFGLRYRRAKDVVEEDEE